MYKRFSSSYKQTKQPNKCKNLKKFEILQKEEEQYSIKTRKNLK